MWKDRLEQRVSQKSGVVSELYSPPDCLSIVQGSSSTVVDTQMNLFYWLRVSDLESLRIVDELQFLKSLGGEDTGMPWVSIA